MSFKTIVLILFLAYSELFVGIKGGNENNAPVPSTSENLSTQLVVLSQSSEDININLNYVYQHWHELLFIEQREVMRLQTQLRNALNRLSPQIEFKIIPTEEILRKDKTILPHLNALHNYLKNVISNLGASKLQLSIVQRKVLTQEVQLLSEIFGRTHATLKRILQRFNELPPLVQKDINLYRQQLESMMKNIDSRMPTFPTREEFIINRNIVLPAIGDFQRYLNNIEATYLLGRSVPMIKQEGQGGQLGQSRQVLQAGLEGHGWQSGQPSLPGLGGQPVHPGWQAGPSGLGGQTGHGWHSGQEGQAGSSGIGGQFIQHGWQAGHEESGSPSGVGGQRGYRSPAGQKH